MLARSRSDFPAGLEAGDQLVPHPRRDVGVQAAHPGNVVTGEVHGGGAAAQAPIAISAEEKRLVYAVAGSPRDSRPRPVRRAAMARAVWLFTAPQLMPIAAATSASERSA